jgi:hypothetical protein
MSEYMEKHNVSRLVGAPPGYVGFEEGASNLANCAIDIGRTELAFRSQRRKGRREPFRE